MQHDRQITISAAGNRKAVLWPAQTLWWSELVLRLSTATHSQETLVEYLRMPKGQQDDLKDVGGFVGGKLDGGRRKNNAVLGRDIVTLDMDAIPAMGADDVLKRAEALGISYCIYSTRKHDPVKPRLRVIIPLHRTVTADEYEPIARKLGEMIGIDWCDPTTFQAVRMMYWPSCCSDGQHIYTHGDKPFVDADGLLALYPDWRDASAWPQVPGVQKATHQVVEKAVDPTTKPGIIGAFCRVYNVYQAMDAYLPGTYELVEDGRYTYAGGSTTGGAVVYDKGTWLYSHHATDPCSGKLVNAFDLVRLHKYGALDESDDVKDGTAANRLPSYLRMCETAMEDPRVSLCVSQERLAKTAEDFGAISCAEEDNWLLALEKSRLTGRYEKTVNNLVLILRHDPVLKGKVAFDEFASRYVVTGSLPWKSVAERRQWLDPDDNALFWYIEHRYKIASEKGLQKAVDIVAREGAFDDVKTYLKGLVWDGVPRLDTLLIDYLNAEDSAYTRAVTRKIFCAAVARAMTPGVKFDFSVILVGRQGKGKSTLLRYMGKQWFLEDLPPSLDGKDASERIQGYWLAEMGELNGLTRSEVNVTKHFLSRTVDVYRQPYGRHTAEYPRRCVIFGSTNDDEFLRDNTGNRRFWPVTLLDAPGRLSVFNDLLRGVDQVWAEAKARWQVDEPLHLSGALEAAAVEKQGQYKVSDSRAGIIEEFVNRPVPTDWAQRIIGIRRLYWSGEYQQGETETEPRRYVCAAEIWCECFGLDKGRMKKSDTREINDLLKEIGWQPIGPRRIDAYGTQRYFVMKT